MRRQKERISFTPQLMNWMKLGSEGACCGVDFIVDDVQIVSRIRSSRVKSSSCILILRIVKKEISCTGVVPATEPPMPKLKWVTQEKLCLVCVSVFVCLYVFLTPLPSGASVYIYLQAFSSFVRWNIKGDIHSLFVTSRRWAIGELSFQRQ